MLALILLFRRGSRLVLALSRFIPSNASCSCLQNPSLSPAPLQMTNNCCERQRPLAYNVSATGRISRQGLFTTPPRKKFTRLLASIRIREIQLDTHTTELVHSSPAHRSHRHNAPLLFGHRGQQDSYAVSPHRALTILQILLSVPTQDTC